MILSIDHILKILSDRNRLRILHLLQTKTLCVCELAHVIGISQPSVSRHLKKLKDAGLVEEVQNSLWTDYMLTADHPLFESLWAGIVPALKNDSQFRSDLQKMKSADRQKLCCR